MSLMTCVLPWIRGLIKHVFLLRTGCSPMAYTVHMHCTFSRASGRNKPFVSLCYLILKWPHLPASTTPREVRPYRVNGQPRERFFIKNRLFAHGAHSPHALQQLLESFREKQAVCFFVLPRTAFFCRLFVFLLFLILHLDVRGYNPGWTRSIP